MWKWIDCNFGAEKPSNIWTASHASGSGGCKATKCVKFGASMWFMMHRVLERNPGCLGRELDLGGRRQPESQVFQGMGYLWKEFE